MLNRDEATSICRQKGMGDRKIQEVMSQLKGGGDVSLECLEDLLREFPQHGTNSKTDRSSETNSCTSTDVLFDDSAITSTTDNTNVSNTEGNAANSTGGTSNVSRGTNFLELANTVSAHLHRYVKFRSFLYSLVCLFCVK